MACSTAWPPRVAPCVMLKAPFQLLARPVRAVETMTASVMVLLLVSGGGRGFGSTRCIPLSVQDFVRLQPRDTRI
eukprot:1502-Eustigmatos_ZCMA.PRE.1